MSALHEDKGWLDFPVTNGQRGLVLVSTSASPAFTSRHVAGTHKFFVDFGRGESEVLKSTWDELFAWDKRMREVQR